MGLGASLGRSPYSSLGQSIDGVSDKAAYRRVQYAIILVILCGLCEQILYLGLVAWTSVLLNSTGPEWAGSLLPTISDGFARVGAIQAVFLTGVVVTSCERVCFWVWCDNSNRGGYSWMWWLRVALTVTQQTLLVAVGSVSTLVDNRDHSILAAAAVGVYLVYEVLTIAHRVANTTGDPPPLRVFALVLEVACMPCFFAGVACFELETCAGGAPFASVYEYIFFFFFAATPVFRILDT